MRSELVAFRADRARTRVIRFFIQPLSGCRRRKQHGRGLVSDVDETDCAIHRCTRREHPLRPGDSHEIFRPELIAYESDIANRVATCRARFSVAE